MAADWFRLLRQARVLGRPFTDRFGQPKERPEVGIMQNARIAFARLLRELALDGVDGPDAPRSPRTADYGSRR
ncbi:hypothetical protein ELI13_31645 [Rhizobium ruizarguesonis]|uniref:Uncharacterized protein n=1 Tax=Rhizobium ruizarguesonis TaxID=2081791 RepID=A0ABY1WZB6_9HYPH|nr:hypothetical protein ELI46_10900 [Rhizobium ruizarguesonis]TAV24111.1 hypothetical protein ELI36_29450 [Rhizobium ruizarguesonis]TAV25157.1 hypothetical protein ELI33_32200 [Rhizobium ruizarguesonis]TAW48338.1 hypothetical protein ELI15_35820 [Rhizobium ruizarguesonis]TAW82851.1 hypothetical protein ELI13_31645 [Rhizobium ruizarguesonis]